MRILIADDEPPARARLRAMVEELGNGEVVAEAADGRSALEAIEREQPDVVLLDIRMPGMDGLEVARHLLNWKDHGPAPAVIFTTAYDSHALDAFEAQAVAYLLKPIRGDKLRIALERAKAITAVQVERTGQAIEAAARTHVSASVNGSLRLVSIEDIRFFKAEHKYVTARHAGGELVLDEPLATIESEFAEQFIRVHRNALVAIEHATALEKEASGHYAVVCAGVEERVEVSRRLLSRVRKILARKGKILARKARGGGTPGPGESAERRP